MNHYRCVKCYFPITRAIRDCDTVTFFPTTVPFPEIKLEDALWQAASDIITISTQPSSETTPSLQAGDPVRNALTTLATQLNRIEDIPALQTPPAASQRVEVITHNLNCPGVVPLPRVKPSTVSREKWKLTNLPRYKPRYQDIARDITTPRAHTSPQSFTPASVLLSHSNKPKNLRFNNKNDHRYPLRSKTKSTLRSATHKLGTNFKDLSSRVLVAQHIFQHKACHIFLPNGTKETIDIMLQGPLRAVWEKV